MKQCSRCKLQKPATDFGKDKRRKDGLRSRCKDCNNTEYREWYYNSDGAESSRRYREAHPEQREISRKKWQDENQWRVNLRRYGLSPGEYEMLLDDQGGVCKICGALPVKKNLAVDHCHVTGKVRSLLCGNCNTALGLAGESTSTLLKMIEYLEYWEKNDY